MADNAAGRVWRIVNPTSTNRLGQPVAYQLQPQGQPVLLATKRRRWPAGRRSPPSTCG